MPSPGGALLTLDVLGTVMALVFLWKRGRPVRLWLLLVLGTVMSLGLLRLMGAL